MLTKIITGRGAISGAILSALILLRHFGVHVPDVTEQTIGSVLDALTVLAGVASTVLAHKAPVPS